MYFLSDPRLPTAAIGPVPGDSEASAYDTKLNPVEETQFQDWKKRNAPRDSGVDYDLRGAFKAGLQPAANGHWPDTYKKPNHPTFSDQSLYAKDRPDLAGSWNGEQYIPPAKTRAKILPPPETRSLWERRGDIGADYWAYAKASDDLQSYRDNVNSRVVATQDAYDARIAAIKDATGVTLENPLRGPIESKTMGRAEFMRARKDTWASRLKELAAQHPDKLEAIRPDVPIEQEAQAITRGTVGAMEEAEQQAADLPWGLRFAAGVQGSVRGMLRDPAQYLALFAGGPEVTAAKSIGGRIMMTAFTEAAVNGAVEVPVQLAAENWRKQSGVALGWSGMWQQVGLAAAFGGGFGGLLQGGREVLGALKKATPETDAALTRMSQGTASPADVQLVVEAAGAKIDVPDMAALSRAIADDADDALVLADGADGREVSQVVHAIENDLPVPRPQREILPPGNFEFFNPDELTVDAARFQFKEGGDAAGVTDRLRGVTEWKPERAGVAVVFEDTAGKRFVADGHQRVGLAKRIQGESGKKVALPGYVFREADGYTAGDVRVIAALKNIGEGSGTAIDAAKVLRSGKMDAKAAGLPPGSALVRDAAGLARLSDDAFTMAVNEVIDPKLAAVVGRLADDKALHAQMISALNGADAKTIGEAESMVRDLLQEPTFVQHQESLFGEAEVARMLLKEKAQVRGATLRALRKDRAVFNSLIEEQKRIAETGNVLDTAANTERAKSDAILIEAIDRLSRQVGPVAAALNEAASAVAGGAGAPAASRGFIDAVRNEIRQAGGNLARIGDGQPAQLLDPAVAGSKLTEPATNEAAEAAAQALDAAGGEKLPTRAELEAEGQSNMFGAEDTDAGVQVLIPGVGPVTIKAKLDVAAAKPMRGGDADPPAGGLFDDEARAQLDIMDALPAGTDAAGKPLLTTHAELAAQADRVDHLADVISSCKG